ncbi:hypothetical protein AVEN_165322-1 [Araneus ventricosus]|uniref:Uncharacterized protein n=1 Tax=Araneus ventricosus TaxID=182803 RepID=A0A4Y2ASX5_ARAVE|nr:hypothetical protein AVEN_165322-1 [Araneus ventricosus]
MYEVWSVDNQTHLDRGGLVAMSRGRRVPGSKPDPTEGPPLRKHVLNLPVLMKIDIEHNKHGGDLGVSFEMVASSLCWRVGALIKLLSEISDSPSLWSNILPPVWRGSLPAQVSPSLSDRGSKWRGSSQKSRLK